MYRRFLCVALSALALVPVEAVAWSWPVSALSPSCGNRPKSTSNPVQAKIRSGISECYGWTAPWQTNGPGGDANTTLPGHSPGLYYAVFAHDYFRMDFHWTAASDCALGNPASSECYGIPAWITGTAAYAQPDTRWADEDGNESLLSFGTSCEIGNGLLLPRTMYLSIAGSRSGGGSWQYGWWWEIIRDYRFSGAGPLANPHNYAGCGNHAVQHTKILARANTAGGVAITRSSANPWEFSQIPAIDKEIQRYMYWGFSSYLLDDPRTLSTYNFYVSVALLATMNPTAAFESISMFCNYLPTDPDFEPLNGREFHLHVSASLSTTNGEYSHNFEYFQGMRRGDRDGDSWGDMYEAFYGTDPYNPLDAPADIDCDGVVDLHDGNIDGDAWPNWSEADDDNDGCDDSVDSRPYHFDSVPSCGWQNVHNRQVPEPCSAN